MILANIRKPKLHSVTTALKAVNCKVQRRWDKLQLCVWFGKE